MTMISSKKILILFILGLFFLNMMKFHPLKCKVLSVTSCHSLHNYILPTSRFAYCLNGECLDYIETEKDLGVHINNKLSWNQHIFYLCSKANRMLGLVKRTCRFVKEHNQKRVLYLSLVSSQFNHCSSVWTPASVTLSNKIERVQVNAIKWILSEEGSTYTCNTRDISCHNTQDISCHIM